jgi:tetratricopeptide (TPR) repeat protein
MTPRLAKRVLLLGWDAADWKIIHPLLDRGEMPVLKRLIETGVSGNLATLFPVISPILWNSIATGKRADKHGILGFVEPTADGRGAQPVSSTSRKAKALWNILSQCGLRSGVVDWYASHPAEPIAGTVFTNHFPEVVQMPDGRIAPPGPRTIHPPDLYEAAATLRVLPQDITSRQMLPFFEHALPADLKDPRLGLLAHLLARCASVQNAATFLAAQDDWDLLAVYNDMIDHAGHGFMEYYPPAMAHVGDDDARAFGSVMPNTYRFHDMLLGRLLDLAGPETTVLLISDHGFHSDNLRPPVTEHTTKPDEKFGKKMNPVAWHREQGIFIASGPGIRRDEILYGATLLDIAPTVLMLLGLPVPEDMDGRALTNILIDPPATLERVSSYEEPHPLDGVHRSLSDGETDPWAARQALEQLAALGYIDMPDANDPIKLVVEAEWDRRWNLSQVYQFSGRASEAVSLLRGLLAERENPQVRCRLAMCLLGARQPAEAAATVLPLLSGDALAPMARLIMGRAKLRLRETGEALRWLEPLWHQEMELPGLALALGQTYLQLEMMPEAEAAFRRALERDEDSAAAHDGLGVTLRRLGKYEDAVYEHMRAASLQHNRARIHANLGIALARTRQVDWAIRAFEQAAQLAPDEPFPHRCLARLYFGPKKDRVRARHHAAEMVRCRKVLRERQTGVKLSG